MQDDCRRNKRFRAWLGAFEDRSGLETNQESSEVLGSRCIRSIPQQGGLVSDHVGSGASPPAAIEPAIGPEEDCF